MEAESSRDSGSEVSTVAVVTKNAERLGIAASEDSSMSCSSFSAVVRKD
jgi:hypothetical protein